MSCDKPFRRLPTNVKPIHYELFFRVDLVGWKFTGTETVDIKIQESTSTIILNAAELTLSNAKYLDGCGKEYEATITENKELATVSLTFPSTIKEGEGKLKIDFEGVHNDRMVGFYRSKYNTLDGEERYCVSTQFENSEARKAFPCWDEPAHKATFTISIQAPKNRVILSNMPAVKEEDASNGETLVTFEKSPIMSTYLVAMVVGEFDYLEGATENGIKIRAYTPLGKKEMGRFALDTAIKILPHYEQYFDIPFPLPKCDLISIPDFNAGAMENWGLVTFLETHLLVDPDDAGAYQRQTVAQSVGHELAHMWFGNLVTMEWWTHLWLNEGYATFVEHMSTDYLHPEYEIWKQFVKDSLIPCLLLDALKSSHPIEVPIASPEEAGEIFDEISYNKGSSVIRMLHDFIGEEAFKSGMRLYLNRHKYKNTVTEDLWDALEEASSKSVRKMMSTWTLQMGFPLLKVTSHQDKTRRVITFKQHRFLADGKMDDKSSVWIIPIAIMTPVSCPHSLENYLMEEKSMDVVVENIAPESWIKVNPGWVGTYRVSYSPDMLEAFMPSVKDKSLPPIDRLSLIDDVFALVFARQYDTVKALQFMEAYIDEDDYTVWGSIITSLNKLSSLLDYADCHSELQKFICKMLSKILHKVGFHSKEGEDHLTSLLRTIVVGRLGVSGDEEVLKTLRSMFEDHQSQKVMIPADMRSPIFSSLMLHGDEKMWNDLLKLYDATDLQKDRVVIASSMARTNDPVLISKVLEFAMSEKVKSQHAIWIICSTARAKVGRDLAWKFFKDQRNVFNEKYRGEGNALLMGVMAKGLLSGFASLEQVSEVRSYFSAQPLQSCDRAIEQALESVQINCDWLTKQARSVREHLVKWLDSNDD